MVESYSMCDCGAITIYTDDGQSYSCQRKNLKKYIPNIDLRKINRLQKSYCCNHCVNHYGMDLCACGSGELIGECENGLEECGKPMQVSINILVSVERVHGQADEQFTRHYRTGKIRCGNDPAAQARYY